MNQKYKYLFKNVGLLTISNFASKILVFLLVPLYTSVLSTAEYGTYDLAISTAILLYPLLTLNIVDAVMRFTMEKSKNKDTIAKIGFRYIISSCFIFGILLFIFNKTHLWNGIYGLEIYIFFYYISYAFNQYLIQLAKGLEKVSDMAIAGVIGTVTIVIANVLFLIVLKAGLKGFFIANIISQVIVSTYYLIRLKCWIYLRLDKTNKLLHLEMLSYSIPLIATSLGWWVNSTSDKYIVSFICGIAANGLLSVSYKIPQIINTLQSIFIQAWQISAIKEYGSEDTSIFYGKTFTTINFIMCITCSLLIIFTKTIASILYSKDFYLAWKYVPFLLISSVFNCASGLLGPILSAKKDSKTLMWSAIIGAGCNIILNFAFIYLIGVQGATIATVICSYIIFLVREKSVRNDIKFKNYSLIKITWGLLCFQAMIKIHSLSVLLEIIILIITIYINKDTIKEFYNIVGMKILSH